MQDEPIRMNIIQRKNCLMIIQEIFPKNDLYAPKKLFEFIKIDI